MSKNKNHTKPTYEYTIIVFAAFMGVLFMPGNSFNLWVYLPISFITTYISGCFFLYTYYLCDDIIIKNYLLRPICSKKLIPISTIDHIEIRRIKDIKKQFPLVFFWSKQKINTRDGKYKYTFIDSFIFNKKDLDFFVELTLKGLEFKINIDKTFKRDIKVTNILKKKNPI